MIIESKLLRQVFPYIIPFTLLIGSLKHSLYFQHFGINIFNYIDITEVITIFLPDLLEFSPFVIIGLFVGYLTVDLPTLKFNSDFNKTLETSNDVNFVQRLIVYISINWGYAFLSIISIGIFFIQKDMTPYLLVFPIQFKLSFLIIEYKRKFHKIHYKRISHSISNLVLLLTIILPLIGLHLVREITDTKKGKNIIEFTYKDNVKIKSDSLNLYIGQTKNFTFLKDNKDTIRVFEKSSISGIKMYRNK